MSREFLPTSHVRWQTRAMGAGTAFSNKQKAHVFVRDRALCCYSGVSLWMLDYGAQGDWHIDWVDHAVPVSRGGLATIENARCASHVANSDKRAGDGVPPIIVAGLPTSHLQTLARAERARIEQHISRFAQLHESDWYLNRALFHLLLGTLWHVDVNAGWAPRKRTDTYYARAALKMLRSWRREARNVESIEARGLLPCEVSADRQLLLDARQLSTEEQTTQLIGTLVPWMATAVEHENG